MPAKLEYFSLEVGGTGQPGTGRIFAFDTGDISFGEDENRQVPKNLGDNILNLTFRKENVTLTVRGANNADFEFLEALKNANRDTLIRATTSIDGEDITIGAKVIENALLLDVQPSAPILVLGDAIYESIALTFSSQIWT